MRIVLLIVGLIAAVFLVPVWMDLWNILVPELKRGITDPHLLIYYTITPYAVLIAIATAAFLIARGKRQ